MVMEFVVKPAGLLASLLFPLGLILLALLKRFNFIPGPLPGRAIILKNLLAAGLTFVILLAIVSAAIQSGHDFWQWLEFWGIFGIWFVLLKRQRAPIRVVVIGALTMAALARLIDAYVIETLLFI
jgi:hypothetical protein